MSRCVPRRTYVRAPRVGGGKRYKSYYLFWPEQARPRRGMAATTAVACLAIGIVCAVVIYHVVTDFFSAVSTQEAFERTVEHVPIYATAAVPVADADHVGSISRTRFPRAVAKVRLPIIGTSTIAQSRDTDGCGGDTLKGRTPAALTADTVAEKAALGDLATRQWANDVSVRINSRCD